MKLLVTVPRIVSVGGVLVTFDIGVFPPSIYT